MTWDGDFVLVGSNGASIWSARTAPNGNALFLQSDGNVIVRARNNQALWTSNTYDHDGAQLIVDDGGIIAVVDGDTPIWFDGLPRGNYATSPAPQNLEFPVRAMFYYPVSTPDQRSTFVSHSLIRLFSCTSGTPKHGQTMEQRLDLYQNLVTIPLLTRS